MTLPKEIYPQMKPMLTRSAAQLHTLKKKAEFVESSHDESRFVPVKKEVSQRQFPVNEKVPKVEQPMNRMSSMNQMHCPFETCEVSESDPEEDMIDHLSGKPFFDVVLAKSHLVQLHLPRKITRGLPCATVPSVLRYGGKNWSVSYKGDCSGPRLESPGWKAFIKDNGLERGDACVFEIMEKSDTKIRFKIHVLKAHVPHELLVKAETCGSLPDNPIGID